MRQWSQVALLAKREFLERARSKPFIITMSLIAVAILAIGPVISALAGGDDEATKIGLTGEEPSGIEQELHTQAALFDLEIEVDRFMNRDEAETALTDGNIAVVLVDGTEIVFQDEFVSVDGTPSQCRRYDGEDRSAHQIGAVGERDLSRG